MSQQTLMSTQLVSPTSRLKASYLSYIEELGDEERYPFVLDFDHNDFDKLLAQIARFARGEQLPSGYVACTTLWLVANNEIVGVTNLRHYLSPEIAHCGGHIGLSIRPSARKHGYGKILMQSSIQWLQQKGVDQVHIHCHQHNQGSARTIIACGGILDSEITLGEEVISRYLVSNKT